MANFTRKLFWFCVGIVTFTLVMIYNSNHEANEVSEFKKQLDSMKMEVVKKLLLDVDCWNRLEQRKFCRLPMEVASFEGYDLPLNKSIFASRYVIEQKEGQDFMWFKPENKTDKARIMVNIVFIPQNVPLEDGSTVQLLIPREKDDFLRRWEKSEFIPCSGKGVRNRDVQDTTRVIPLSAVRDVMAEFRDFCDANNKTAYLFHGTLLGWYRECSLIPHTTDLDYGMDHTEHSDEFEAQMEKRYLVYWMQGAGNETDIITYHKDKVKTDLFFEYPLNDTHSYTSGFVVPEKREIRWLSPKTTKICSTNLLDTLMYVPCNAEEKIRSAYGNNWMVDAPSRNQFFQNASFNTVQGRIFNKTEWMKVYRTKKGFY